MCKFTKTAYPKNLIYYVYQASTKPIKFLSHTLLLKYIIYFSALAAVNFLMILKKKFKAPNPLKRMSKDKLP